MFDMTINTKLTHKPTIESINNLTYMMNLLKELVFEGKIKVYDIPIELRYLDQSFYMFGIRSNYDKQEEFKKHIDLMIKDSNEFYKFDTTESKRIDDLVDTYLSSTYNKFNYKPKF